MIPPAAAPDPAPERLYFLDWLRIAAMGVLLLFHVGMAYVSWDWHVKSAHAGTALEPWMRLSAPWRMSLLFIVSGAACASLLARPGRPGEAGFVRRRSSRLLWPLLFGMAVWVPPQAYAEVLGKYGYTGSYVDFLRLYFSASDRFCRAGECLALPTWNHLWFLPYLWLYSVLLWALLRRWPAALQALADAAARRLPGWRLLVLPLLWLVLLRLVLFPRFGSHNDLFPDAYNHALYGSMFLLGAVLARQPTVLFAALARWRWWALGGALLVWLLLSAYFQHFEGAPTVPPLWLNLQRAGWAVQQWGSVVAALGFASRHWNHDHPWRAPLTQAVFPVYIAHQTLIVLGVEALRPLHWPAPVEGGVLVLLTLTLSLLAWRLALRLRWARVVMGLPAAPDAR